MRAHVPPSVPSLFPSSRPAAPDHHTHRRVLPQCADLAVVSVWGPGTGKVVRPVRRTV